MNTFRDISEKQLFTLCLYGEARGEPVEGKIAVASVIVNRLHRGGWYGDTLRDVILKPYQFSCFLVKDPNRQTIAKIAREFGRYLDIYGNLRECYWVATGFLDDWLDSNVGRATHYHAISIQPPYWAAGMIRVARIGRHIFYEEASP